MEADEADARALQAEEDARAGREEDMLVAGFAVMELNENNGRVEAFVPF
jgi:hypothetical protein